MIRGYCAIGSQYSAIPPIKVMTTDRTVAKIGRSMKKRESMAGDPFSLRLLRVVGDSCVLDPAGGGATTAVWPSVGIGTRSGVISPRLPDLQDSTADDPVVRFQPFLDHPQTVFLERARRDPAGLDLVVGIEHIDVLPPLPVRRDGPIDDQERLVGHPDRQADFREPAG